MTDHRRGASIDVMHSIPGRHLVTGQRYGLLLGVIAVVYPYQAWATCTATSGATITTDVSCTSVVVSGGATVNNAVTISGSGADSGAYGNAGTAIILMSGGSLASPDVLNNTGTITNTQPGTATISSKGVIVNGYATINNSGTISQTAYTGNYSSGILYWVAASGGKLNLNNLGTISAYNFGVSVQGPVGSIINGSSTNATAVIGATNVYGTALNFYGSSYPSYPTLVGLFDNYAIVGGLGSASGMNINANVEIQQFTNETTGNIKGSIGNSGTIDVLQNNGTINNISGSVGIGTGGTIKTLNNSAGATIAAAYSRGISAINNGGTIGAIGGLNNAGTIDGIKNFSSAAKVYDLNNSGSIAVITNLGLLDALNTSTAILNTGTINGVDNSGTIGSNGAAFGFNSSGTITGAINNSGSILGAVGINMTGGRIGAIQNITAASNISSIAMSGTSTIGSLQNGAAAVSASTIGSITLGASSTLTTLTNYAQIAQISNSGTLTTFYNYYTGGAQAYSGNAPGSYYMYFNSDGTLYSKLALTSAAGSPLKFGLMNAAGVATNATYADVITGLSLSGISSTLANSITGSTLSNGSLIAGVGGYLTGTWSNGTVTRSWWLVEDTNNSSSLDLCFDVLCTSSSSPPSSPPSPPPSPPSPPPSGTPNITTDSGNVFTSVHSTVTNVFDGGTLTNGSDATSTDTFTITSNNGTIDAAGNRLTFTGSISNDTPGTPGKLIIDSSLADGVVVLAPTSGTNTFSGGLDVLAGGTVEVSTSGALGTGPVSLIGTNMNAATLNVAASMTIPNALVMQGRSEVDVSVGSTATLAGAISGGGALTLTGGGTANLTSPTGVLGAITVTGNTTVYLNTGAFNNSSHADIVPLNASLAPLLLFSGTSLTVDAGSTLRGAGYINAPTTVSGVLRPGNSPGTIVFGASVTQAAGSILALDIDGLGVYAGAGNYSSVIVNGTGNTYTANGTVQPILRGITGSANNDFSPAVGSIFTVVSATGGVLGSFTGITQPGSGLLTGTQFDSIYNTNTFQLVITPSNLSGVSGLTPNEKAVGGALQAVRPTPGVRKSAAQAAVYDVLYKLPVGGYAPAYDRISFAIYGDALMAQGDVAGLMGSTVADQMAQRRGASLGADGNSQKYCLDGGKPAKDLNACRQLTVWGNAVGQFGRTSATLGDPGYTTDNRGLMLGADAEVENNVRFGAFAGYAAGLVNSPRTAAKADLTTWSTGVYGAVDRKDMFVNALASFVSGDQKVTRNPLGVAVSGRPNATGALFALELGARYAMNDIVFEPNVGLKASNMHRGATNETGASPLAASLSADSVNTALASLGARSIWRTKLENGASVTAVGRVGYGRELGDQGTNVTGAFTALNTSATVASSLRGRDAFLGGVSMAVSPSQGVDVFLRYDTELRSNASSQSVAAGLKMSW